MNFTRALTTILAVLASLISFAGATIKNNRAVITFDDSGRVSSIKNLDTGRELQAGPAARPFCYISDGTKPNNVRIAPLGLTQSADGKNLTFAFARGTVVLAVEPRTDYFVLDVKSVTLPADVATPRLVVGHVDNLACRTYSGRWILCLVSDDADAVLLRGLDLPVDTKVIADSMTCWTQPAYGLTGGKLGARFLFAVARKPDMTSILRRITTEMDLPKSSCGGAWSDGAEINRRSYLFADLAHESTDNWIDLLHRMGYKDLHIHAWWKTLGTYEPRADRFPNGLADMKDSVDRLHKAGLLAGVHTLSCGIETTDDFVRTPDVTNLLPWTVYTLAENMAGTDAVLSYTLAKDMSETDTVISVTTTPSKDHDTLDTYHSNGNTLRIGEELISYGGVLRGATNAFIRCSRGVSGTKRAAHKAGDSAAYLQQVYGEFYPRPDSPLADKLAKRLGYIDHYLDLDEFYMDGSEGMRDRLMIDQMMRKIFAELKPNTQIEASGRYPHAYWFDSRIGTWDNDRWAPKRFHDRHLAETVESRKGDLIAPQMGWWAPKMWSDICRGHFLDEIEYFACKNLGIDGASSIQGVDVNKNQTPFAIERQLTILGQWERMRLARYFDAATCARCAVPGDDYHLTQNSEGVWSLRPATYTTHRLAAVTGTPLVGSLPYAGPETPAALRFEVLEAGVPYTNAARAAVALAAELKDFSAPITANGVKMSVAKKSYPDRGFDAFAVTATNPGTNSFGASGYILRSYKTGFDVRHSSFGLWIKGDGSGVLFDMHIKSMREFGSGQSDHIVKVDWTGWRYVQFFLRERDAEEMQKHDWPFVNNSGSLFRSAIQRDKVGEVSFYLNEIPAGKTAHVEFSDVYALPVLDKRLQDLVLTVNGTELRVPFSLGTGDIVELDSESVRKYSPLGDLQDECLMKDALVKGTAAPVFKAPATTFSLAARADHADADNRIELTTFAYGAPVSARNPAVDWSELRYDYDMPVMFAKSAPEGRTFSTIVRKEHAAAGAVLNFDVIGPVSNVQIRVGSVLADHLPDVAATQRLSIRDGKTWTLRAGNGIILAKGTLATAFPALKPGVTVFTVFCSGVTAPRSPNGRISWFKDYGAEAK